MTDDDGAVRALFDRYTDAVAARDVDAFVALFDDDIHVFDMWGVWSYRGLDAWRRMTEEWFGSLGDEQVAVRFDDVETQVDGDSALALAYVSYAAIAPS